jgi:endonuclease-8
MPEGDTVWFAAERLRAALAGHALVDSDFRVPRYATVDLAGRQVLDVVPRGKHLLTRFSGGLTLHTHFEMDGTWQLVPHHQERGPKPRPRGPEWQLRIQLRTADWAARGYRIPVIDLGRTEQEDRWTGHLGPDVLGPDWDLDVAVANLRREPAREIGDALLDQRNLAGPGNIYRTDALFLASVSPWSPVAEVADLPQLVTITRDLMVTVRDSGNQTQTTTGSRRHGEEHWVVQRAGQPCRRCGTRIRRAPQGEPGRTRVTAWCPRCQPGPLPATPEPRRREIRTRAGPPRLRSR